MKESRIGKNRLRYTGQYSVLIINKNCMEFRFGWELSIDMKNEI